MNGILIYLLKVAVSSGLLFGYYWFALRNRCFHRWNRFYLLASVAFSLVVPFLEIPYLVQATRENADMIRVLQVIQGDGEYDINLAKSPGFHWGLWTLAVLYMTVTLFLLYSILRVYQYVRTLSRKYPRNQVEDIWLVMTDVKGTPFSFFQWLFWNKEIDMHSDPGKRIFRHELAHVREKHSHDKIFMQFILSLFWMIPFFWWIRKELEMIHEFIADQQAVEGSDTAAFAEMILHSAYPAQVHKLLNPFFYSPIKRRLLMLTKLNNPKVNYMGKILALPLMLIIGGLLTLKLQSQINNSAGTHTFSLSHPYTVVIDAGHGGTDPGAKSMDGKSEKDLTLLLAQAVKRMNVNPNLRILLSRSSDDFIKVTDRTVIADKEKADLFISLHIDASPPNAQNVESGINMYISTNDDQWQQKSRVLASALQMHLKKVYNTKEQLYQRKTHKIWVLDHNERPSVLIHCGNMSSRQDLEFISVESNREDIAKGVLNGIEQYLYAATSVTTMKSSSASGNYSEATPVAKESVKIISADTLRLTSDSVRIRLDAAGEKNRINSNPLIFLDGKEISMEEMKIVNPDRISSVNIIKGNEATTKYGNRARDGVIQIITKPSNNPEKPKQ